MSNRGNCQVVQSPVQRKRQRGTDSVSTCHALHLNGRSTRVAHAQGIMLCTAVVGSYMYMQNVISKIHFIGRAT